MSFRGVLLVGALLLALTACGGASVVSPPAGVDGLTIPTPSPDPADFVTVVDNPWLPLAPGSTWTYAVSDGSDSHPRTVVVEPGPEIAGVATTARVTRESAGVVTDYFAQDAAGNVWWFGREGSWQAGVGGAEAGIAMLAVPRVGDGYRPAYATGVVEETVRVVSLDTSTTVPSGTYDDLVVIEERSALGVDTSRTLSFARDVGVVEEDSVAGDSVTVRLVSADLR